MAMNRDVRRGFNHLVEAVTAAGETSTKIDLAIGWSYGIMDESKEKKELLTLQAIADDLVVRLGAALAKVKDRSKQ